MMFQVLAYVRLDGAGGGAARRELRARMHRADGSEDAGTGSANCALAGLLASLDMRRKWAIQRPEPIVLGCHLPRRPPCTPRIIIS